MLPERFAILQKALAQRTRYITVCLEDIYQSQNVSAVLRSCDAFGVQDVHLIEKRNTISINRDVVRGTDKWLTLHKYGRKFANPTQQAVDTLKSQGYRIVATTPHHQSVSLQDFDVNKGKFSLFFGTEQTGLSADVLDRADDFLYVPMCGFVESLNLSVCAAICLQNLTQKVRNSTSWQLALAEQDDLLLRWVKKSVRDSERILQAYANPF